MCQKPGCPIHKLGLRTPENIHEHQAGVWIVHAFISCTEYEKPQTLKGVILGEMLLLRHVEAPWDALIESAFIPEGTIWTHVWTTCSAGFCSLKWVKRILNWKWHLSYSQTNIALTLLLFLYLPWCLSSTASTAQLFWYSLHEIDPKRKHVAPEGAKETILCQSIHCIKNTAKWIHMCVTFLQELTSFLQSFVKSPNLLWV